MSAPDDAQDPGEPAVAETSIGEFAQVLSPSTVDLSATSKLMLRDEWNASVFTRGGPIWTGSLQGAIERFLAFTPNEQSRASIVVGPEARTGKMLLGPADIREIARVKNLTASGPEKADRGASPVMDWPSNTTGMVPKVGGLGGLPVPASPGSTGTPGWGEAAWAEPGQPEEPSASGPPRNRTDDGEGWGSSTWAGSGGLAPLGAGPLGGGPLRGGETVRRPETPAEVSRADGGLAAGPATLNAQIDTSGVSRAKTAIGKSVLRNAKVLNVSGAAHALTIEARLQELRRQNTDEAHVLISDYEKLKELLEAFLFLVAEFAAEKKEEAPATASAVSLYDGIQNWWSARHVEICQSTFDAGLFTGLIGICWLAGASGPLAVAVSGALAGKKQVVDAMKALAEISKSFGGKA